MMTRTSRYLTFNAASHKPRPSVNATASLYVDAGFADATEYFKAFDVQAKANPPWARKLTAEALAKPCLEPAAAVTPNEAPAPSAPGKTP